MTKYITGLTGLTGGINDITGRTGTIEATGFTRVNHTNSQQSTRKIFRS